MYCAHYREATVHGPLPMNIHEVVMSPRQPRSREGLKNVSYVADDKASHAVAIFAHPNLAFGLMTRHDPTHGEGSMSHHLVSLGSSTKLKSQH